MRPGAPPHASQVPVEEGGTEAANDCDTTPQMIPIRETDTASDVSIQTSVGANVSHSAFSDVDISHLFSKGAYA